MTEELIEQSRTIRSLIYKIQDALTGYQVVNFFRENPDRTQQVLDSTEGIRSRRLILYGLAERLQSEVLPLREALADRNEDWLTRGDVILGWSGALIGSPRVILGLGDDGYSWRYLDDAEDEVRSPVALDKWFQHVGWELAGSNLSEEEIYDLQHEEIDALNAQLEYFSGREFLNAA